MITFAKTWGGTCGVFGKLHGLIWRAALPPGDGASPKQPFRLNCLQFGAMQFGHSHICFRAMQVVGVVVHKYSTCCFVLFIVLCDASFFFEMLMFRQSSFHYFCFALVLGQSLNASPSSLFIITPVESVACTFGCSFAIAKWERSFPGLSPPPRLTCKVQVVVVMRTNANA